MPKNDPTHDYVFVPMGDAATRLPTVSESTWHLNRPISGRQVTKLLKTYAKRAGLNHRLINVRALRRTAAMLHREAGASLDEIARLLGHSHAGTTRKFLKHPADSARVWVRVAELLKL